MSHAKRLSRRDFVKTTTAVAAAAARCFSASAGSASFCSSRIAAMSSMVGGTAATG